MDEYSDFDIRRDIIQVIKDSDSGIELQYHLMKNPDILDSVNSPELSQYQVLSKLAKIEASLKSDSSARKPSVAISNAPPPIKPVRGYSSKPQVDLDNMSVDEFIEYRNKTTK